MASFISGPAQGRSDGRTRDTLFQEPWSCDGRRLHVVGGITKSGALESIRAAGRSLTETQVGDNTYWLAPDAKPASSAKGIRLLPTYDEYGIGYKDRSTIISRTN